MRLVRHMNDAVNATQLESEGVLRVAWSPAGDLLTTGGQDRTLQHRDADAANSMNSKSLGLSAFAER